jgi:hypothetical protein
VALELVGDRQARGEVPYVIGGQEAPLPARYIVGVEQALRAAEGFFETGAVDAAGGDWDRDRVNDAWTEARS